ncbi:MAG: UDP-N-acetyl glucosamine 2-epimerase [Prevotella sp.]
MNICIVAGARPNFVKVAPIIRAVDKAQAQGAELQVELVYAGSESDPTLEPTLFEDLQMRHPDVYLGVDCENLNELTGNVMSAFDRYLCGHPAHVVIVVDDLASTMAAAIVTKKHGLALAHLVAGTRSFDINMPKEINRLVIDGLSDFLFTAGMGGNSAVAREGAEQSKVYMVGNILMDTLRFNYSRLQRPDIMDSLSLEPQQYIVFTLNRKALLADEKKLREMLEELVTVSHRLPVVAPLRSSASEVVRRLLPSATGQFCITEPLSYLRFGYLTAHARGVVTDSGNVAEEATFNSVPCITLNSYTEHQETVKVGSNVLVGEDAERLRSALADMTGNRWKHAAIPDRWDGRSAERIVQILREQVKI